MIEVSLWKVISSDNIEWEARITSPEEFSARAETPGLALRRVREIAKHKWLPERMKALDTCIKNYKQRFPLTFKKSNQ